MTGRSVSAVKTPNLLSDSEYRGFWVVVRQGEIEVGKEGETLPYFHWKDNDPLPVHYYSLSSWTNTVAKWIQKCNFSGIQSFKPQFIVNYESKKVQLHGCPQMTIQRMNCHHHSWTKTSSVWRTSWGWIYCRHITRIQSQQPITMIQSKCLLVCPWCILSWWGIHFSCNPFTHHPYPLQMASRIDVQVWFRMVKIV